MGRGVWLKGPLNCNTILNHYQVPSSTLHHTNWTFPWCPLGAEHIFNLSVPASIPEEFSKSDKPSQGKSVSETSFDRGLEDSYYEECDVGTPRYTLRERYVEGERYVVEKKSCLWA